MGLFSKNEMKEEKAESMTEINELKDRVLQAGMPEAVLDIALKEIDKLAKAPSSSAEYTIGINYLTYLSGLPWNKKTEDNLDLENAKEMLQHDHFGLAEVKERILEHLAVRILKMSRQPQLLLVDDEKMARKNLEYIFQKENCKVTTAASGTEALQIIAGEDFDVVITDLKMEKVDGMQVLEEVKRKNPDTDVIMITGYATVPVAVKAMQKGSAHFLSKPLKLNEIRELLKELVKKKNRALESKGPILCFVGPPGTGKTSLGQSIAGCLGRKFIRISLAGIKDEAEIRGHRRSYVGALPGRIIQEIRRAESINPVIMLDEIDKLGTEFKGDPSAALLELLDPEQNNRFMDHYLDAPFDLSKAIFIATANTTDPIPPALLDRLEILSLSGYTEKEKETIAFEYLIPKEFIEAGLNADMCCFSEESIRKLIREYTREAGLRNLQRCIASICRKIAKKILEVKLKHIDINPEIIEQYLGPPLFHMDFAGSTHRVGVSTGLALTEAGGQIMFVEAAVMKGSRQLILTGCLGDIMKESAQAALSYLRSQSRVLGIDESFFDGRDIHIHVPAGAVPKDGPSAGLPIAVALYSVVTNTPCNRTIALTGETTLTGRILPVGGIKEKALAAHRAGVKTVILPAQNQPDIRKIPDEVQKDLKIILAGEIIEILETLVSD